MEKTDLIARIESAGPEEQEKLLLEAYDHCPHAWKGGNVLARFESLLDAKAYLDAALMLMPDGTGHDPYWMLKAANPNNAKGCRAEIWVKDHGTPFRGRAPTPALALLAAILKAGG